MKTIAIIPARYQSSRFEGKPLALINNKPMIMWVYDSVKHSNLFDEVLVATDDTRILKEVEKHNGKAMMTSSSLSCGTERCKAVVEILEEQGKSFDVAINIQGDEPLIKKEQIQKVLDGFIKTNADIVTLRKEIEDYKDVEDSNVVKVVCGRNNKALYFSRSVIPFDRETKGENNIGKGIYFKHIGIYGYKTSVLKEICSLPESLLERTEKLEQLRWLENGYNIIVNKTDIDTIGVDTPQDLENVIRIINKNNI